MAVRKPLVIISGQVQEQPAGDSPAGAEPPIAAASPEPTGKYWRGDKTWRDFFTDVRGATLTGLSTATNAVITASDTVLGALGKLQKQISDHLSDSADAHAASAISNTPAGGIAATTVQGAINELDTEKAAVAAVREKLTAARTYYVRTDGNDSNTGLANTSGGAFLTIQKAVDTVASLDLVVFDATIFVGTGTWTAATALKTLVGAGQVIIRGINADTTSTVISTTSASCFSGTYVGQYRFEYLKLQTTTSGRCLQAVGGGAVLRLNNINFGAAAQAHISAASGAFVDCYLATYSISGGAPVHVEANDCAVLRLTSASITLSGSPVFAFAFAAAGRASSILIVGATFSGSGTGSRYAVSFNSVLFVNGAGTSYLPGDSAGTTPNGGQYA